MGKVGKFFDTLGKWIVILPGIAAAVWGVHLLTAPGTELSRRAFAERAPVLIDGVLSANTRKSALSMQAYLDCPSELPASTQIMLEREGFSSARCTGPNGVRIYDLPLPISPNFYITLGAGLFGFIVVRRAKRAPTPPA